MIQLFYQAYVTSFNYFFIRKFNRKRWFSSHLSRSISSASYKWSLHPFTASIELTLETMEFLLRLGNMNLKIQHVQPPDPFSNTSILGLNILHFYPQSLLRFIALLIIEELHLTASYFSDFTFFYTNDTDCTILLWIKNYILFTL